MFQLERLPSFSTICAKNQVLKLNIDKDTVILITQMPLTGDPPQAISTKFTTKYVYTFYTANERY
jgi:hypothetical protein